MFNSDCYGHLLSFLPVAYSDAHSTIWPSVAGNACRHSGMMTLQIFIPVRLVSWNGDSVVSCQGVAAVLLVTAVIIMRLTEGTAAKML